MLTSIASIKRKQDMYARKELAAKRIAENRTNRMVLNNIFIIIKVFYFILHTYR